MAINRVIWAKNSLAASGQKKTCVENVYATLQIFMHSLNKLREPLDRTQVLVQGDYPDGPEVTNYRRSLQDGVEWTCRCNHHRARHQSARVTSRILSRSECDRIDDELTGQFSNRTFR